MNLKKLVTVEKVAQERFLVVSSEDYCYNCKVEHKGLAKNLGHLSTIRHR